MRYYCLINVSLTRSLESRYCGCEEERRRAIEQAGTHSHAGPPVTCVHEALKLLVMDFGSKGG